MIFKKKSAILKIPYLYCFINEVSYSNTERLGWGRKKSFFRAQVYAEKHGLHVLCLEDGFIRSLGLGKNGYNPLSLVADETGIYFDALQASDLENLILLDENEQLNKRAQANIKIILDNKITKYNQNFKALDSTLFKENIENILVIDQTFGDQSIYYAGANLSTFNNMLQQAIKDHPRAIIWVKIHPDVLAGKSKGHFSTADLDHPQIKILSENYNPIELLAFMQHVYVVSSQLGFEALLCRKQVHCFGVPWYAGWGLTDDTYAPLHILNNRRTKKRSLSHLFACAYLKYARYVSPITQQKCELEDILELLIPNINFQKRLPNLITAYGFSAWKKQFIREFLGFPNIKIKFKKIFKPSKAEHILAWGKKARALKLQGYHNVITVEDGFIRSVGLGASLVRPCSLVFDDVGIYYDATRPSRLENLLKYRVDLTIEERQRAEKLRHMLIDLNITKYNVGIKEKLERPCGYEKVILVVGQVEDDMSIQLGGVDIKTNLSLLKTVKDKNPTAYIIYKPHPDVLAGLRIGDIPNNIAKQFCHKVETTVSILECFEICDELHTISSLSGFEALIRGMTVYCYGLPFYAGWGLTVDQFYCNRRNINICLEKMIYCSLIEYPLYNISHIKSLPNVQPEDVIRYLKEIQKSPYSTTLSSIFKVVNLFKRLCK